MKNYVESYSFTGLDGVNQDVIAIERISADVNVYILIDGMGAYRESGDVAKLISKVLISEIKSNIGLDYEVLFIKVLEGANIAIKEYLYQHRCKAGATLAIFVQHNDTAHISWLGDVRVYSLRDEALTLLTNDHKAGAHLVSRSINGREFNQNPPYKSFDITSGDQFIMCSDGAYTALTNEQIVSLRDNIEHYNKVQFVDDASIIYINGK